MAFCVLKYLNNPLRTGFAALNATKISANVFWYKYSNNDPNTRGLKSLIKIKWKRPEPVPFNDPRKSGDQITNLGDVDYNSTTLTYVNCPSIKSADENVKKVFSCNFQGRKHAVDLVMKDIVDRIKRHEFDEDSREAMIAKYTVRIRSLQEQFAEQPLDKVNKTWLKILIEKRNKQLRYLRMEDYKKFEWLLEELNIVFRPGPSILNKVWRKDSLRKLVDKHIEDTKADRLVELRNKFNEQKIEFYKKKAESYEWILEQEKKYGKPPTVSQEEIDELWKKYKDAIENKAEAYERPKHYHQFV